MLRWFLLVPPAIALYFVASLLGAALQVGWMTVFWRRKYPDWLFRGAQGAMGFTARVGSYALLTTDQFPSFSSDDSPVTLEFDQPPSGQLSRWRVVIWKSLLLIPHFIVLYFLALALWVVTFIAWFGILFSGNYPRGLFQFSVGVQRWFWRVNGYFASFNDRFPPYSLSSEAGPASNGATVGSGIGGLVLGGGFVALVAVAMVVAGQHQTESVSYAQLLAGRGQQTNTFDVGVGDPAMVRLSRAVDPGDSLIQIIRPARGERIIVFQWTVVNGASSSQLITADAARLEFRYNDGGKQKSRSEDAEFIGINNVSAPARVAGGGTATVQAVFIVPDDAEPTALWFHHGFLQGGVKYEFR
jgi:hypothetical protein